MKKNFITPLIAAALILCLSVISVADTIRLKDGSVIRGQVVGFKDQQFTILLGSGARGGRRSRITIYMEDVESIEFDAVTGAAPSIAASDESAGSGDTTTPPVSQPSRPAASQPSVATSNPQPTTQPSSRTSPNFFQINARVRGDNTTNGWTNTGLVVRRGQRLRISATGRVSLGAGRFSTPSGIATLPDREKLMRNEPTGALIAVIGDDNDDFILIGRSREFVAQRDGVLFLGVNEGNLNDNTGAYDAVIEAEAVSGTAQR
ncbi:MAG TPA: hypothetical protein VD966_06740 [Pyrinomonadaceae bacterium]|nr:hypothetical protein [Pyrinomonadaceae bacterium]